MEGTLFNGVRVPDFCSTGIEDDWTLIQVTPVTPSQSPKSGMNHWNLDLVLLQMIFQNSDYFSIWLIIIEYPNIDCSDW